MHETGAGAPDAGMRDEELETSRLLVEFLHATYATRRLDQPAPDSGAAPEPAAGPAAQTAGSAASTESPGAEREPASGPAAGLPAEPAADPAAEPAALASTAGPDGVPVMPMDRVPGGASAHVIRAAIHVYQHGDRTVSQLAAGLGISMGWASRVADELVERGHAVRERDPNDRRVVRLRMTPAALEEIERAYRWRGDVVGRVLVEHTPAERAAIRRFLRRVTDEMTNEAARRAGGAPTGMPGGRAGNPIHGHPDDR